ncbi:putative small secreted protein [Erwinia toletana]|uniref:Small secreted protein n=1 Tax=Winslowiella toletana TaxID=92490 RepID=A0ABS4P9J2_9GAMM|nr:YjbF family lipoprotein [Winslowiella toletana]MBP2169304.1 putative small secreted protein [Winslowiella toletana]
MRHIPLLLLCLLLQACTQTQKGIGETVKIAVTGLDDVAVTNDRIRSVPYASMYLRIDNGQRIFVVLGYDEDGEQKWITQDQAMLVTRKGRLVKTLGLSDNLVDINNLQQDPLAKGLALADGDSWTRTLSWTENQQLRSGTAVSHFSREKDQVLDLAGRQVACRVYREEVEMTNSGKSWENIFWIDATTGQVRQTQQALGADYIPVETTILKPAKS